MPSALHWTWEFVFIVVCITRFGAPTSEEQLCMQREYQTFTPAARQVNEWQEENGFVAYTIFTSCWMESSPRGVTIWHSNCIGIISISIQQTAETRTPKLQVVRRASAHMRMAATAEEQTKDFIFFIFYSHLALKCKNKGTRKGRMGKMKEKIGEMQLDPLPVFEWNFAHTFCGACKICSNS